MLNNKDTGFNPSALIAHLYRAHELPSKDRSKHWMLENNNFVSTDYSGKWCIFVNANEVDHIWGLIKEAVKQKKISCAKTATNINAESYNNSYVICVYTEDWQDQDEVFRVRNELVNLGITQQMKFKRDIDTRNGKDVFVYE